MTTYFAYILRGRKDNKSYTSSTADIKRRVKESDAEFIKATKTKRPFTTIYGKTRLNKQDALAKKNI